MSHPSITTHESARTDTGNASKLPEKDDPFVREIADAISSRELIPTGSTVLVACSGGADSTALLYTLAALSAGMHFSLAAAHVHHGLRGEDADGDACSVRTDAELLGIPFHLATAEVKRVRSDRGGSLEEQARWARFTVLEDIASSIGADLIATAHHMDDQAETVLMHLFRGSGLTGLRGMGWRSEEGIIRPFLGVHRHDIRAAMERWGLTWREDESNQSLDIARNRMRHATLPELAAAWNPRLVESLSRTAELLGADEEALTHAGRHALSESTLLCGRNRVLLDRRVVQSYSLGIRRRLLRLAAGGLCTVVEALSFSETERLIRLTGGDGHVVLRGKLSAWSSRGVLGIESADLWTGPMQVHPGGAAKVPGWGTLVVESMCPDSAADREIELQEGPFTLRRWRPGDAIDQGPDRRPAKIADLAKRMTPPAVMKAALVLSDAQGLAYAAELAGPGIRIIARRPATTPGMTRFNLRWVAVDG